MTRAPGEQLFSDAGALLRATAGASVEGLYLHIPFCFHKCHYCDFYSIVDQRGRQTVFTERLIEEAEAAGPLVAGPIRTIFVGGGTPTLLRSDLWEKLLAALRGTFDLTGLDEFTVEANPETVTPDLLRTLAAGGVNRVSLGAQSFDPRHLKTLERWHEPANVGRAFRAAREAGIENVSMDLIFAIPGQSLEDWRADLRRAIALSPSHLSCYGLTYEPNTPLTGKLERGRITPCDESREARMYRTTLEMLGEAGYEQYEISNFARPERACRHNLMYWRGGNWLALGPSAAGHINGLRWKNVPHLGRYLASAGGPPIRDVERLDPDERLGEQIMLGLRLTEGIERRWLEPRLDGRRRRAIDEQIAHGLLERTPTRLRLTARGQLLADSVIAELL